MKSTDKRNIFGELLSDEIERRLLTDLKISDQLLSENRERRT
jgi:hypothetical protein